MRRVSAIIVPLLIAGCQREEWNPRPDPPFAMDAGRYTQEYEGNAYALSQGQQFFEAYNCSGCHSHGGGGMGPPLMDARWFYGSEPKDIFTTIAKGRPNGMPAFEKKIPAYQIWQLVAYVRSLSGLGSQNASPGREDHMRGEPPQNSKATEPAYTKEPGPDVVVEPHFLETPK
jgi:cytochrome c oxidase cbb3-type subunit III